MTDYVHPRNSSAGPRLIAAAALILACLALTTHAERQADLPNAWLNIHGIGWDGPTDAAGEQLRLARGLGYRYAYHGQKHDDYEGPHRADLFFYYNDAHKHIQPFVDGEFRPSELAAAKAVAPYTMSRHPMLPRAIDEPELRRLAEAAPGVFQAYKRKFEVTKSWANSDRPFPDNLAQLQTWGDREITRWEPSPNYQLNAVIDEHVAVIVAHVKAQERPTDRYLFKGVVFDVPDIWNEFNWSSNRPLPGTPDHKRSSAARPGVTHDFATLQEGWYHFLDRLHDALEVAFPDRDTKVIHEPAALWSDWGQYIADIPYDSVTEEMMDGIRGDAMVGEKPTLEFLTQQELFDDGWTPDLLGNVTADLFPKNPSFPLQLVVLGECAARGSNFFSYGTFAREFRRNPHTYSADLLVIRIVAGWENSHATPLAARLWDYDNRIYLSPTAVADEQSLAAVNPYTGEVQGTLRSPDATIQLAQGLRPAASADGLRGVNAFFEPVDGPPPLVFKDGLLKPRPGADLPLGFRLRLDRTPHDGVYFTHPKRGALVHRPQDTPFILRDVHNPGFELGGDGWYTGDGGRTRVVPETEVVQEGRQSGKLIERSRRWHSFTQRIPDVVNLRGPGRYRMSAWARPAWEQPTVHGSVHLKIATAAGGHDHTSEPVELPAGQWSRIEAELDLDFNETVTVANLSFRIDHARMPYFLDGVTFEKVN